MVAWHVPLQALHARADLPPSSCTSLRRVKRVLVAEDDPDTAAATKLTLEERLQITVDHVTNGALVLDQVTATHPDALILYVSMPGLNGIFSFNLLRFSDPSVDVPVPCLTATPDRAGQPFA